LANKGNALTKDLTGDNRLRAIGAALFKRLATGTITPLHQGQGQDGKRVAESSSPQERNVAEIYMRACNSKSVITLMELQREFSSNRSVTIIHGVDDRHQSLTISLPLSILDGYGICTSILEHICWFMKTQIEDMSAIRHQYSDIYRRCQSLIDHNPHGDTPVIMHFDRMFERLDRWFAGVLSPLHHHPLIWDQHTIDGISMNRSSSSAASASASASASSPTIPSLSPSLAPVATASSLTSSSSGAIVRMPRCDHCHHIVSGAYKCAACEYELCYACFINPSSSSLRLPLHHHDNIASSPYDNDDALPPTSPRVATVAALSMDESLTISGGVHHHHQLQYPTRIFDRPCNHPFIIFHLISCLSQTLSCQYVYV
jgi:hypothetical protein